MVTLYMTMMNSNVSVITILLLAFIAVVILPLGAEAMQEGERPFVTTWRVDTAGGNVTIPVGGTNGTYTISWGDGTFDADVSGDQHHTYTKSGNYTISIHGDFTRIYLNGEPNSQKLLSIEQWGDIQWESMGSAFYGASNMVYSAADSPNLSAVTNMSRMFYNATSFNGDISSWDVSSVADMSWMFYLSRFNGDISSWDVSSVTDMNGMFWKSDFNGDISSWDVSSVTGMSVMFSDAQSFNGDLSTWDVSSVTDMHGMFAGSPFTGDLSTWDVSSVTDMSRMFVKSTFNGTHMFSMFSSTASFDQNLGNWYITIDNTSIEMADVPGIVGTISAQNAYLDGHNPTYTIIPGGDSDRFEITDGNKLIMVSAAPDQESYTITITVTGRVFQDSNHQKDIQIVLR